MYHGFTMLFVKVKKIKFHPCRHVQCNRGGGECWCVNAEGLEIPGSRQMEPLFIVSPSSYFNLTRPPLKKNALLAFGVLENPDVRHE